MRVPPANLSRAAAAAAVHRRCATSSAAVAPHPPYAPAAAFLKARSFPLLRNFFTSDSDCGLPGSLGEIRDRILLLTEKPRSHKRRKITEKLKSKISELAQQLLALSDDDDLLAAVESSCAPSIIQETADGPACIELLKLLGSRPSLSLEFFKWRRKKLIEVGAPMLSEEYAKGIMLAGRAKDIDLAVDLFNASGSEGLRTTSTYNSLMGAYMYSGSTKKCLSLFEELKRDAECEPTIGTYNILLSVFGRSLLVNHMETVLRAVEDSKLKPTLKTYNTVIAGYVTAWMWDKMEDAFQIMKDCGLEPDTCTHLLMLRGYAHKGDLEKMEKTYKIVKEWIDNNEQPLVRTMICAYCKSSDPERVRKIEELCGSMPESEYRPWLNVLLIRLYAQEGLMEKMEDLIHEAFRRGTTVTTVGIMNSIISSYFRHDALEHLTWFVSQAESAGWRLCRSLYHCEMVMYGKHSRFSEMKNVISQMEASKLDPSKKTFWIMYKVYSSFGKKFEANGIVGLMWKLGFIIYGDAIVNS